MNGSFIKSVIFIPLSKKKPMTFVRIIRNKPATIHKNHVCRKLDKSFSPLKNTRISGVMRRKVIAFSFDISARKKQKELKIKYFKALESKYFKTFIAVNREKSRHMISSRPLILATASVCIGWLKNNIPKIKGNIFFQPILEPRFINSPIR